jgi:hypothetical protein
MTMFTTDVEQKHVNTPAPDAYWMEKLASRTRPESVGVGAPAWGHSLRHHLVVNHAEEGGDMALRRACAQVLADAIVNGPNDTEMLYLRAACGSATIHALRDGIAALSRAFDQIDRDQSSEQLRESAAHYRRGDFRACLQKLAVDRGLSWHTIATMLGVTPTAIRKWRRGGRITAENREQLGALTAFFDQLDELDIDDLGSWIEMRAREDATITPAEIYHAGPNGRWLLLEWARGRIDATTMLDRFDAGWRKTYARDPNFRVVRGSDGERAIVPR